MENDIITTKTAKIWMGEDNIIRISHYQNVDITLQDMKDIVASCQKVSCGKPCPLLVDARYIKSMSHDAREHASGQEVNNIIIATATLVGSPVSRTIVNFFMKLNKPLVPTKLFTDEDEAFVWLKGFL